MKKFFKTIRKTFKFCLVFFSIIFSFVLCYYFFETKNEHLNLDLLKNTKTANFISFYDKNGRNIQNFENKYIKLSKLSSNTKNAFLCAEDKRFYSHKGIDPIRIIGAVKNNLQTKSFSQGGSTISQQLIKNIQLSNEKTISRKLKEIKLTLELERKFNKNEILEMYLNSIYFGSGCYGIEEASNHYFNKSASELSLEESALLAGTINAPSYYDIQNNFNRANKRKELILKLLKNNKYISEDEYKKALSNKIILNIQSNINNKNINEQIIDEASSILKLSQTQLNNSKLNIISSIDGTLQGKINKIVENYNNKVGNNKIISTIILDNKTKNVVSTTGKMNALKTKIQPGSTIKPIYVYAPAIEFGNISPATKILDETVDYNGYKPSNADKKTHGYVSVRDALKHSYNIPAVKILNEIGVEKAQKFANNLGINFSENDENLATALGAMTDGVTLKSLADAYMALANEGNYESSKIIEKIVRDNKTIYEHNSNPKKAMEKSTAYLICDMLIETAKSGTAKRLGELPFQVASKTGTVGKPDSSNNIAAINVSFTTQHTIVVYIGGKDMPANINGSSYPTMIAKDILNELYKSTKPSNFKRPSTIKDVAISKTKYDNNIVAKTDNIEDSLFEKFIENNIPQYNDTLSNQLKINNNKDEKPIIQFYTSQEYNYKMIRKNNNSKTTLFETNGENKNIIFIEKTAKSGQIYEYYYEIYDNNQNFIKESNHVKIKSY